MQVDERGYYRDEKGVLIHRKVAYEQIYLPNKDRYALPFSEYVVHHIDRNKKNNDKENLILMVEEDHNKIHRPKIVQVYSSKKEDGLLDIIWNIIRAAFIGTLPVTITLTTLTAFFFYLLYFYR